MNELEYGLILQSLSEGVCCIDHTWNVTCFNRAAERITGRDAEDALNQPFSSIFDPNVCRCVEFVEQAILHGTHLREMETRIRSKNGLGVPIRLTISPILGDGEILGAVMTFRDESHVESLRKELACDFCSDDIVTKNAKMRELLRMLPAIGDSGSPVLLTGESGTGKELFAHAIHRHSLRNHGPFVAVNCGALPDTLLESELFGYRKGAFTDAREDKPGRFALAEGGTLFLDEVGDISPTMQVKLLRVLQEKEYQPLGSVKIKHTDVRIVAATNRDLRFLMQEGLFRQDLFFRLGVVSLVLPPLRDRTEDIPLLAAHFLTRFNAEKGRSIDALAPKALARLMRHPFPGNIRELQNILERAYITCPDREIQEHNLLFDDLLPSEGNGYPQKSATLSSWRTLTKTVLPDAAPLPMLDARRKQLTDDEERELIENALQQTRGHRRRAAELLGIDPSTLWRKIKRYGVAG